MWEVVLDTSVLIAAMRSRRGASHKILRLLGSDSRWRIHLSTALLIEYQAVLSRLPSEIGCEREDIDILLDYVCQAGFDQDSYFKWRPALSDPGDEFILDLAVAAQARFIITFNRRDFAGAAQFGIEVVTPSEFLARLEAETT